ncbi:MAG: YqgE/AlgH family protein, partial [Gammaproteobacteria bacterium]|nr:YqgE/AlgH family protein [Gammaproteobacteria bacterium]
MDTSNNLRGHLLIAMPSLTDPNFSHTVTYIVEHNEAGT